MTVPTSHSRVQYDGNDAATEFDYTFKIFDADDLVVVLTDVDDNETTLVRGSDYSVDGVGDEAGGTVTYPISGTPLATGETLTILREIPVVQETDLRNQGRFYPETIEEEFDRSRMIDQQVVEVQGRALKKTLGGDNYDAGGARITNLGDAVDLGDAASRQYMEEYFRQLESGELGDTSLVTASGTLDQRNLADWMKALGYPTTSTGTDRPLADALDDRVVHLETIADFDTLVDSILSDNQQFSVAEYNAGSGIGGGRFYWDASSTEAADGASIFQITGVPTGRMKRIDEGDKFLVDSGAIGDGSNEAALIDKMNVSGNLVNLSGKTFTYTGTFTPIASFYNGAIVDSNRTYDFSTRTGESNARVIQGRARIDYNSGSSVNAFVPESIILAGFRFFGAYRKPRGRSIATGVNGNIVINDTTDLSILNTRKTENWYAVFAGANNIASVATFVNAPFFRAFSVTGNEITLGEGKETTGENHVSTTYDMDTNIMVGSDVLVIQEGGIWSGRTTSVTANTNGTITLSDASGISPGDFFLVAPPEFSDYCYLGSWYLDSAEPRNRADEGVKVGATMGAVPGLTASGALSNAKFNLRGVVSPLATAYLGRLVYSLSTASTGAVSHSFRHDSSSHPIAQHYYEKVGSSTETVVQAPIEIPFSKEQAVWIEASGSRAADVSGRGFNCYGWVEP